MDLITSLDNKKIKYLNKLKDKKFRDTEGLFIIETENLIEEACQSNLLEEVYLLEDSNLEFEVPTYYVTKEVMQKISSLKSPSKCLGIVKKIAPRDYQNRLLILDNIQDPGNLGTIIRTADSANIKQILVSKDTVDSYSPKVVRSTMGAIYRVKIIECENLAKTLKSLQTTGFEIVTTDLHTDKSIYDMNYNKKIVVIGNEANGVTQEIRELSNYRVKIPMLGKTESLNAAVATGIMIYEYVRQKIQ